jgi:hypothetical protein
MIDYQFCKQSPCGLRSARDDLFALKITLRQLAENVVRLDGACSKARARSEAGKPAVRSAEYWAKLSAAAATGFPGIE